MFKKWHYILVGTLVVIFSFLSNFFDSRIFAESFVPDEYIPNYHIAEEWDELLTLIIEIEASQKV